MTARADATAVAGGQPTVWWAPRRLEWWTAALFMVGAFLFALGSVPGFSSLVESWVVGAVFFLGSLFFTTAAYTQFLTVVNVNRPVELDGSPSRYRFFAIESDRIDWWGVAVQLAGTLAFNVTTFRAMWDGLSTRQEELLVWRPDVFGSVCFLVASYLAVTLVCHRWWCRPTGGVDWWIAMANMVGSVFFGAAAVASFVLPDTGELLDASLVNGATFVGAACFFIGAVLLIPAMRDTGEPRSVS